MGAYPTSLAVHPVRGHNYDFAAARAPVLIRDSAIVHCPPRNLAETLTVITQRRGRSPDLESSGKRPEPSSRSPKDPHDRVDLNAINFGHLGDRHAVPHPGADAREMWPEITKCPPDTHKEIR
jgi:hypothetical protein